MVYFLLLRVTDEEPWRSIHVGGVERVRIRAIFPVRNRASDRVHGGWPLHGLFCSAIMILGILSGCDLMPSKPEAVFILYRDRMKSEKVDEARQLLSDRSREMVVRLEREHRLKQLPEDLALLNMLDPVSPPLLLKGEQNQALIQLRCLKGGMKTITMVRQEVDQPWRIEIGDDLKALEEYLGAKSALDTLREQSSEYAASWKAFKTQLERIQVPPAEPAKDSIGKTVRDPTRARNLPRRGAAQAKTERLPQKR